jgi:hypothetical protein
MANRNIQLLPAAEFLKTLDASTETCASLLGVKAPTVKIPPNIKAYMRTLAKLNDFWAKNRSTYTALVEAAATSTPKRQSAGA